MTCAKAIGRTLKYRARRVARHPAVPHRTAMFEKTETSWRKARRQLVRKVGVNILAKIWIRSKRLRTIRCWSSINSEEQEAHSIQYGTYSEA
jgi:hypothetical protein